ncbi:MAG TPA: iron-containing alcohol dehydrogenase [Desulfosalsimonadaceae bacterium]|nr:iron-containing alcohol dehydrogenase [Desulfosalsimonadaceae bacterium]
MKQLAYEFLSHPKIASGTCSLESIPAELACNDAGKPLVVTSREASRRGLGGALVRAFADSDCLLGGIYDEVRDYAGISLIRQAADLFVQRGCDALIALGGGAVVEVARAVNILVSENTEDLFSYFAGQSLPGQLKPLVWIPACRVDGTEPGKTITVEHRRLSSEIFIPDVIVIDKRMTPAKSRRSASESAVLAIDNALAALLDDEPGPMKDAFVHASLSFISNSLGEFVRRPANRKHSHAVISAGVLAGIAAANADPGLVRVLSEELEKETEVSRAVFAGILLPAFLGSMQQGEDPVREELLLAAAGMDVYAKTPPEKRSEKGVETVCALLGEAKRALPASLEALSIPYYRLEKACESAASRLDARYSGQQFMTVLELAEKGGLQ